MAANDPFVRIFFENHDPQPHISGGLFNLHTTSGKPEIAAVSIDQSKGQLTYEAWPSFVKKFSAIYPIGKVLQWGSKNGLSAWLDSLIYCSFLLHGH